MHIIKKLFLLALALGLVQASPASISDRDIMGKKKHKEKPLVGGWTSPAGAFIPIGSDDWKLRPSSFSWNKNDCFINSWQRAADADWTNVTYVLSHHQTLSRPQLTRSNPEPPTSPPTSSPSPSPSSQPTTPPPSISTTSPSPRSPPKNPKTPRSSKTNGTRK